MYHIGMRILNAAQMREADRFTIEEIGIPSLVLMDDAPGEVLPVGRGPELPGLLTALDQQAVRPG